MAHLSQRHFKRSAVQIKARAVIRKYKHQLRQLEFKRLRQLVPSMQDADEDPSEVSFGASGILAHLVLLN